MSKSTITCPNCKHLFSIEDVITEDLEKQLGQKFALQNEALMKDFEAKNEAFQKMQLEFEAKKKNENSLFAEKLAKELEKSAKEQEEKLLKKLTTEHEAKIIFFQQQQEENEAKLKDMRAKELEVMNLQKMLNEQRELADFNLKKQRLEIETELKEKVSLEILGKEREKFDLEKRELEKQLNDQKKLTEQMTRKLEQGSMQTQGEVQEIALEELLAQSFPFDLVEEVAKGIRGADCILTVRNELGQNCGKIIFESKRTKEFSPDWLTKLKDDAKQSSSDACVLVTQTLPKDIKYFDQRDGVWICKMNESIQVVKLIREGIINVFRAQKSQENKGEKKEMLYNYFTSQEFRSQLRSINEAYLYLRDSIQRERLQMEKIWKEREKQIDKVLLNNSHLIGSIQGIAGSDVDDLNLLD